jgi:hypothetical protein
MIAYQPGQKVQFNVEFSHEGTFVPVDAVGTVKSVAGDQVFVRCRRRVWMCYWFEVRLENTPITSEMRRLIAERDRLLEDFANWEAARYC